MKRFFHTLAIISFTVLSLYSCKSIENPIGKIQLNEQELKELVFQLDEYKNYVNAFFDMEEQQKLRASSLNIEDEKWLQKIHDKYPNLDKLFEEGTPEVIEHYNYLTGRDLYHEDSPLAKRFELLTEKLDQNYLYNKMNLADLLIPYTTK